MAYKREDGYRINSGASEAGKTIAVGSTSNIVLAENVNRVSAVFRNYSDEVVTLAFGRAAVAGAGIVLNPAGTGVGGDAFVINRNNLTTCAVYAICASGSKNLSVVEF